MANSSGFVPPSFRLVLTAGPCSGQELSSASGKGGFALTVGRTRVSKLYIRDTAVSEKHAVVAWNGAAWVLRDCGSSNGTAVNGQKLQPMVDAVALKDGDQILFGLDTRGTVKLEPRCVGDLTVEQLLASLCEAAAHRIESHGQESARQILTELGQAKATIQKQLDKTIAA